MTSATNEGDEPVAGETAERACMACRGSGTVISHLGGVDSTVTCPWCDGTGVRVPGLDAQARWPGPASATENG
jgi:DnaJ-class molecular chaperone